MNISQWHDMYISERKAITGDPYTVEDFGKDFERYIKGLQGVWIMNSCNYCGSFELSIEEDTGREYCLICGHYTGCTAKYGGINELGGDYWWLM